MPKFEEQEVVGTGTITLKTIKKPDGSFETTATQELKNMNTEGVIETLKKMADKLYREELCSQGRKCEQCEALIPNYFVNDLCWDCYKRIDERNRMKEKEEKKEEKKVTHYAEELKANISPFATK